MDSRQPHPPNGASAVMALAFIFCQLMNGKDFEIYCARFYGKSLTNHLPQPPYVMYSQTYEAAKFILEHGWHDILLDSIRVFLTERNHGELDQVLQRVRMCIARFSNDRREAETRRRDPSKPVPLVHQSRSHDLLVGIGVVSLVTLVPLCALATMASFDLVAGPVIIQVDFGDIKDAFTPDSQPPPHACFKPDAPPTCDTPPTPPSILSSDPRQTNGDKQNITEHLVEGKGPTRGKQSVKVSSVPAAKTETSPAPSLAGVSPDTPKNESEAQGPSASPQRSSSGPKQTTSPAAETSPRGSVAHSTGGRGGVGKNNGSVPKQR